MQAFGSKFFLWVILLISFSFIIQGNVFAAPSNDTLEAYWKFDQTSQGDGAIDSSGDGNNGMPFGGGGGPFFSTDVPSVNFPDTRSADFNGSNQYFVVPNEAGLNTSTFTMAFWVKLDTINGSYRTFAGKWDVGINEQFLVQLNNNNRIGFWTGNGLSGAAHNLEANLGLSTGTWYHVAAVANGTSKTLYINGTANKYTAIGTSPNTSPVEFTIGSKENGSGSYFEFLDGKIDDLRFYSRVLSETEINQLASGNNTSATWDGSSSSSYETAANWNINAVPDPFTIVTIANAGTLPVVLSSDITTAGLTVATDASLDLAGFVLHYNDGGVLTNNGTIYPNGIPTPTPTSSPAPHGGGSTSESTNFTTTTCVTMPTRAPDLFQINTVKDAATLFYTPVSDAQNYLISYGFSSEANQYNVFTNQGESTGVLSYTVGSLPSDTQLFFKVFAQNNCGQGAWSNTLQTRTSGIVSYSNSPLVIRTIPEKVNEVAPFIQLQNSIQITPGPQREERRVVNQSVSQNPTPHKKSCFLFICW